MGGKNDLFWLTAHWILHSDTEGSFDCVLMFSPTYYCIDLMAAKTHICDLIFLQQFFPLNQTCTQISRGQKNAFNWSKSLRNSIMQEPLWKTAVCCLCQTFLSLLENATEINAQKKRCIINKWFYFAECPHTAEDWVVIISFFLIKTKRFLPSIFWDQVLMCCSCHFEWALRNISRWCHGSAKMGLFQRQTSNQSYLSLVLLCSSLLQYYSTSDAKRIKL